MRRADQELPDERRSATPVIAAHTRHASMQLVHTDMQPKILVQNLVASINVLSARVLSTASAAKTSKSTSNHALAKYCSSQWMW
jgi:TATA-box binding protein (TBP) (component of TFIID and TFIIIB)